MTLTLKSKDGQAIRKLIPLTTLPEAAFNKLCAQIRIEEGPKGTVLFKQGDQKSEFVYLLEGTISLQAAGMEMDTITGGSEEARFALAHQIPRKVFAVAKDKIRFIRVNAEVLNSTTSKQHDSVGYEVSDIPESSGDWMTTLLKSPIFQRLPAANLQKVLTRMEEIRVNAGALVVKQGDPGDYYYIIKKGRCSLTRKPSKIAKEIKLAELKTTDTFGEDSLISGAPRNVNITMLTDGIILRLSKENFLELIKKPVIQTVSIDQAINEVANGAVIVDVRTPDSFEHGHLEGSRNIPFFSLRMQIANLDPAKKLIVVCEDGNTSEAASFLLIRYAFDAVVLEGGFNAVPGQYLGSLNRDSQSSATKSPTETGEATSIASTADEKQALEEARQITSQLQKQLQSEREKREKAERDHGESNVSREAISNNELDLRKQIEVLNRECETANKKVQDYRDRSAEAENKLVSANQASARANQEFDELKLELRAKIQSLESEISSRQAEIERALNQSADEKQRLELEAEHRIDRIKENLERLEGQIAEKNHALESTQKTLRDSKQWQQELSNRCTGFEAESLELRSKLEIACLQEIQTAKEITRLTALNKSLEEDAKATQSALKADLEAKIAALMDTIRLKDQDLESMRENLVQHQKSAADSRRKLDELSRQYEQSVRLDEKTKSLDEVTSLRKLNAELEALVQELTGQVEQSGMDDMIDSLKTELGMVREQAENDVKMMKEQLDRSQKKLNRLEQELKVERRRVAELEESSCRPLSLNPAFTAVDSDVFEVVEEEETKPSNPIQPSNSRRSNIGKFISACIISGVASLAGAGGFLLGTENGRDRLQAFLRTDSPIRFLSQSKHSASSERGDPNNAPPDDVQGIHTVQRKQQTGTGDFEAGSSTSFKVELEPGQTIGPKDPDQ
ncbi:MAG: cyclic nucleotide-binding domain-containing protein [Methylococcales bacterium]